MKKRHSMPASPAPRKILASLAAVGLLAITGPAAAASDIVISQVYGSGGNAGATYKNDFVELFNRGNAPISLNGWSVQYASATGTGNFASNSPVVLSNITLQPGQYYLIQQGSGGTNGITLPSADVSGTQNMSGTAGKIALVNVATGLACNGSSTPCTVAQQAQIVDMVGFGTANYAEGSPAPSPSPAIFRKANGCTDTDNNNGDFQTDNPTPRNTASPLSACGGGSPINAAIVPSCPALTVDLGVGGSVGISATDADSTVTGIAPSGILPAGITLDGVTPGSGDGSLANATLNVAASVATGNYSIPLTFTNNEAQSASCSVSVTVQAAAAVTRIYDIQGEGNASPLAGTSVTTEGIVTAVFPNLSGYYLQDESGDGNTLTSDGIFVYAPGASVSVGQKLRVTATVSEYNTVTELTPSSVQLLGNGSIAPTDITLPEAVEGDLERYEGMLVRIVTPLSVSQNYFLGRYGQVTLSAEGRMEIPTNRFLPGSTEAIAQADLNARRRLLLDDGSSAQNPNPIPFIGANNTLRVGDTIGNLTGVIDHGLITSSSTGPRDYKLHPTVTPVFTRDNPRTATPASVGGNLKVASANVLNYFTTFTDGKTASGLSGQGCTLGGATSAANCRGADNAAEFARQQAKIVAALKAVNADVVGLMEIQNNGSEAVQNLVGALNTAIGSNAYAAITNLNGPTGTDAIRVAMIYKPAMVTPVGAAIADSNAIHNRPPLAQTFQAGNGEKFSVIVNHFKSKGCSGAAGADADQNDGQGCYNDRRKQQATALLDFIGTVKTNAADSDVLVIGDLNAYGMENPITTLTDGGLNNVIARYIADPYSYTFDGESGYLDHALASASLTDQITGVAEWHINTDEPSVIDYNTEFKPQDLYTATPYRASDHDPVIVGLQLMKRLDGTGSRDILKGTAADEIIYGGIGSDVLTGGAGNDQFVYRNLNEGVDTITDFTPGQDRVDLRSLLASIGYTGTNPFNDGWAQAINTNSGVSVQIDPDGPGVAFGFTPLVTLRALTASQINTARDFRY